MTPGRLLLAAFVALGLYAVVLVHGAGQTLLALTLLLITGLALWTYISPRTNALRYLFPGVAAAVVFVIFPMLYTFGIGFTNYSSVNLLDEARARAYLLEEAVPAPGSARAFTLQPEGPQWRLRVEGLNGAPALQTQPFSRCRCRRPATRPPNPRSPRRCATLWRNCRPCGAWCCAHQRASN